MAAGPKADVGGGITVAAFCGTCGGVNDGGDPAIDAEYGRPVSSVGAIPAGAAMADGAALADVGAGSSIGVPVTSNSSIPLGAD